MQKTIIITSPLILDNGSFAFELQMHLRNATEQQLISIYHHRKPYDQTYETEILNMKDVRNYCADHKHMNRNLSAFADEQQLHVHYGETDKKPYICWPGKISSEQDAEEIAKKWAIVTAYAILKGQEVNHFIAFGQELRNQILEYLATKAIIDSGVPGYDMFESTSKWMKKQCQMNTQILEGSLAT